MSNPRKSDLAGIWAVTWRSLLLLPVALLAFGRFLGLLVALVWPLCLAAEAFLDGAFARGGLMLAAWGLFLWAFRRWRWHRFLEVPVDGL